MRVKVILGLAVAAHLLSFLLMLARVEPFYSVFYTFAWWTYILFLAALNHLRGRNSYLFDRPREFMRLFLYSTLAWLLFEAFNFRLQNWHYSGVPSEIWIRWPGYFVAFGTVFPGIFETQTLLRNLGVLGRLPGPSLRIGSGLLYRFLLLGGTMLSATLWKPHFFYPLVWLGFIFLLEPVVYRLGPNATSFLARAEQGDYGLVTRLLATGMVCGLLWEFWNFWAGSKWHYAIPFFDTLRLFEMPVLGFFGFPPFSLECYLLYQTFEIVRRRLPLQHRSVALLSILLLALYCGLIFSGIDRLTVTDYRSRF